MEWDGGTIWRIALGVFFLLSGAGIAYALFRLGATFKRVSNILGSVESETMPILTRVETTLDEVNSELEQVGAITESVAKILKVAEHTTTAVHKAVATPLGKLAEFIGVLRGGERSSGGADGKE